MNLLLNLTLLIVDTDFSKVWPWIIIAGLVLAGLIYLFSSANKEIHQTNANKAKSLGELLDVRDKENKSLKERNEELVKQIELKDETIESLKTEYKSLAGIVIHELLDFHGLQMQIRIQEGQLNTLEEAYRKLNREHLLLKNNKD